MWLLRVIVFLFLVGVFSVSVLGELVTYTAKVCHPGDANVVWLTGNTYFLNVDNNIDVKGCMLSIQPGVVVKYKKDSNAFLKVDGSGILIAQGSSDSKIVFTSSDDNSVGDNIASSDGVPLKADYNTAIFLGATASVNADSNDLFDLNIGFAKQGIVVDRNINSIHDSNFHDSNSGCRGGSGVFVNNASVSLVYNNTFNDNNSYTEGNCWPISSFPWGYGAAFHLRAGSITRFYNNVVKFNGVSGTIGAVYFGSEVTHFYNNTVSNNAGGGVYNQGQMVNFYGNLFQSNQALGAPAGFMNNSGSITNFFENTFQNNSNTTGAGAGMYHANGLITNFFSNTFSNNQSISGHGTGISVYRQITNFYNNTFSNNVTIDGNGGAIYCNGCDMNYVYNNLFVENSAKNGGGIAMGVSYSFPVAGFIRRLYNNTFFDNNANSGVIHTVSSYTTIQNLYNNIFAFNTGTAIGAFFNTKIDSNFNAFWGNDANGSGYTEGAESVYLGASPFTGDASDRNFLLNNAADGGTLLIDAGNLDTNNTDTNDFFSFRTTQSNNKLDANKLDIGYHYDQNGPYVQVLSPNDFNTLTGVQTIDFNVESAYDSASVITAALAYSSIGSGNGTAIVSQSLSSYSCSQGPVFRCSYSWNTTAVLDGNYFIRLAGTDTNDTAIDFSDVNFATVNDSTAPVTSVDYNNAWQNVDANVVLTCVDASGCLLTQFRLDSDSSDVVLMGAWQAYDANILVSSDGNWGIDFNSSDTVGNRETTNRVYVRIDKSLPSLSLTVTSVKTVGLSATLSFLGSSESGIKKYWISSDGGTTYSDNGTTETYSFSVSSAVSLPHTRRVYIKAMNNADINTAAQSVDVLFEPAGGGSTSVSCGNNICEVDENASVCPLDCPNVCGDRACTHTENNFSCPFDCAIGCGNGICEPRESKQTCPTDCDPTGGQIVDVNVTRPDGSENPLTVPLTPQNKACESDSDCGVSSACSISRCIRNQCYGGQLPEGEPCDVGSVCKAGVCANVSQQLKPVSESDPILWVSIGVILLALGAIGFEYFKK